MIQTQLVEESYRHLVVEPGHQVEVVLRSIWGQQLTRFELREIWLFALHAYDAQTARALHKAMKNADEPDAFPLRSEQGLR